MSSNLPGPSRGAGLPRLGLLFQRPREVLRNPNFRLFLMGQLVSQCGGWMQRTAQAWLVLDLTGSPVALGLVPVLQFGPILLLSLVSGVLADRFPKRAMLAVTQTVQMLQALILATLVLSNTVQLWHVYLLAFCLGVATAFEWPARQAFVGEMVGREELPTAVALNASVFNAARIAGPSLGGLAIAAWGVGWCFLANGLSFVAVLAGLALMRPELLHPHKRAQIGAVGKQLSEGLRYASRSPEIALPLLVMAFVGTFGYNFSVTLPLLARYSLDVGAVGFGVMNTALGVGALSGALMVASFANPAPRTILLGAVAFGVLLLGVAAAPWYLLVLGILVVLGFASVTYSSSSNATVQINSREEYRGRVMGLYALVNSGTAPMGGAFTGVLADLWGVRATMILEAWLCILGAAVGALYLRRQRKGPRLRASS